MRLASQTTARIAREVRELIVSPESGVYLVVDEATGLPQSLQELTVRVVRNFHLPCGRCGLFPCVFNWLSWCIYIFLISLITIFIC